MFSATLSLSLAIGLLLWKFSISLVILFSKDGRRRKDAKMLLKRNILVDLIRELRRN